MIDRRDPISFIKYIKAQLPTKSRHDIGVNHNLISVHWLIDNYLKNYEDK